MSCNEVAPIYGQISSSEPGWTGGARSIVSFTADCFFGFSVPRGSTGVVCGLNNANEGVGYREIKHAFIVQQGFWRIIEAGAIKTPSKLPYDTGDQFFILRIGGSVIYCVRPAGTPSLSYTYDNRVPGVQLPGPIVYVSTLASTGTQFLDASFYTTGDQIDSEVAGEAWYPGVEESGPLAETAATATITLPLTAFGVARAESETPISALGYAPLPFDVEGTHKGPAGANIQMGFSVFGSGETLTAFARLQLPLTTIADAGGNDIYLTQQGADIPLAFEVTGSARIKSQGANAQLPFKAFGTGRSDAQDAATAIGNVSLPFRVVGGSSTQQNGFVVLFSFGGSPLAVFEEDVAEQVLVSSARQVLYANNVSDTVSVAAVVRNFSARALDIAEQLFAAASVFGDLAGNYTAEVSVADALTFQLVALLTENVLATSGYETQYHAVQELVSGILVGSADYAQRAVSIAEAVDVLGSEEVNRRLVTQVVSAMTLDDTATSVLTICVTETANMQVGDSFELDRHLLADIVEHLDAYTMFRISGDVAEGWVMNTEGQQPISEYDNFVFNSMTYYKGQMITAGDAGIYTHGADTDAGTEITAAMASMLLDFGSSRMKRIRSAYLGYTAANELVMKVRSVHQGQASEHWYKATQNATAAAPEGSYMQVGQGLKSRYWQFELTNIDGGDFEIDKVELHPLILNRRV